MPVDANNDFAELAQRYDAWYAKPVGAWADRFETETVFRMLALQPGERLLDLGAGTCRHAVEAARCGASVSAVDRSEEMLAIARQRVAGTSVALVRADAAHLPFAAASFDVVLTVASLCSARNPGAVLGEVERVLHPGGRLVLGELNRLSLWALLRRPEGCIHPTTYRIVHFRDIGELRRLSSYRVSRSKAGKASSTCHCSTTPPGCGHWSHRNALVNVGRPGSKRSWLSKRAKQNEQQIASGKQQASDFKHCTPLAVNSSFRYCGAASIGNPHIRKRSNRQ